MESRLLRSEPYRLLFPFGIAAAAIGIGVWIPYYFWPQAFPFPGQGHAVIQIQGFLLCFVFGFLGTMLPKVMSVEPMGPMTFALFPILIGGIISASLAGLPLAAQWLHLAVMLNFLAFVALRFPTRKANPPPFFLFIAVAMLANLAGTFAKIAAISGWIPAEWLRVGSLLQYQAFPLLLIMGVGGFLLPKLFSQGTIDPKALLAQPRMSLRTPAALSAIFIASFVVETAGILRGYGTLGTQVAYAMRAGAWAWFLLLEIRIQKFRGKMPPYLTAARISLIVLGIGLLMPVLRPAHLLAWEHIIFLSGYLRLTLSVASRVMAAHAGRLEILGLHARKVRIYGMLIVLAMVTRIATEIWSDNRWLHLAIAAGLAMAALYIWGRIFLPLLAVFPRR